MIKQFAYDFTLFISVAVVCLGSVYMIEQPKPLRIEDRATPFVVSAEFHASIIHDIPASQQGAAIVGANRAIAYLHNHGEVP